MKIGGTVSEPVRQTVRRQIATGARWRGAADRARRAVALSGGVCYTFNRCAAMGDRRPATKRDINGTKNLFPVRVMPYASRIVFYHCAGGDFCKWR